MFIESNTSDIHARAELDMHLEARLGDMNILAGDDTFITTLGDFNNKTVGNIYETAVQIHMNGPGATLGTAATTPAEAIGATDAVMIKPLAPTSKEPAIPIYIAPTIDIMLIDLPDPAPADGMGLGINANDPGTPGSGYGGENIRALHDTINDIIAGNSNTSW